MSEKKMSNYKLFATYSYYLANNSVNLKAAWLAHLNEAKGPIRMEQEIGQKRVLFLDNLNFGWFGKHNWYLGTTYVNSEKLKLRQNISLWIFRSTSNKKRHNVLFFVSGVLKDVLMIIFILYYF